MHDRCYHVEWVSDTADDLVDTIDVATWDKHGVMAFLYPDRGTGVTLPDEL